MNRIITIIAIMIMVMSSIGMIFGADSTSMTFLDIAHDARSIGMGETGVSVADDAAGANYYNNGGLGLVNGFGINITQNIYFAGINGTYLAGYVGLGRFVNFGISAVLMYSSFDSSRYNAGVWNQEGKERYFSTAISASYGLKILDYLGAGLSIKYVGESLNGGNELFKGTGSSMTFDIGVLLSKGLIPLTSIGIAIKDIGLKAAYGEGEKQSVSSRILAGVSVHVLEKKAESINGFGITALISSLDFQYYLAARSVSLNIGFELGMKASIMMIYLRAGYKIMEFQNLGAVAGLSGGFGVEWKNIGVDYAIVPAGNMGITHRISAKYRMGFRGNKDKEEQDDEGSEEVPELDNK